MGENNRFSLYLGASFLLVALLLITITAAAVVQAKEGDDDNSDSVNASQGLKLRGDGTVDDDQTGIGFDVSLQAQAQAGVNQDDDSEDEDANDDSAQGRESGQANAANHRSAVANFVKSLLEVADREGGIGEQVRVVAQAQNASAERTVQAMEKVQTRSKIKTFLFGSDYKNLGSLRSETVQTRNRLGQLNQLMTAAQDEADKTELQNQIQALEQEQVKVENFIKAQESKISLFGWLAKMFQ